MCVRVGTSPRGERMASRRAIAGAPSSVARCGGASVNARRARVARARRRRARATREGDEDAELESASASASAPAASRAHVGPHDVEVKRTTPRPTRAVTRTGAATTKSAKHAPKVARVDAGRDSRRERERVSRDWRGRGGKIWGRARTRTRGERFPYGEGFAFARATCETEDDGGARDGAGRGRATDAAGKRAGA